MKKNVVQGITPTCQYFVLIFSLLVLGPVPVVCQEQLNVEGDVKIRGNVDLHSSGDTSSIYLGEGIKLVTSNAFNTFMGVKAGGNTSFGRENAFFGYQAGSNNEGGSNAFFGYRAGKNNDGASNTFFGYRAGQLNDNSLNAFFGSESGHQNTTGEENTFFGAESGFQNTTGAYNTFLGYNAGTGNVGGSNNTFVGREAGAKADTLSGSIAIGNFAKVDCNNCAVIGSTGDRAVRVGIGTDDPDGHLDIYATSSAATPHILINESIGTYARMRWKNNSDTYWDIAGRTGSPGSQSTAELNFFYNDGSLNVLKLFGDGDATLAGNLMENSDRRLKRDLIPLSPVIYKLAGLSGYYFHWQDRPSQPRQIGLVAQEVQNLFPELVQEDENGILSISYTKFIPVLIEGLKEQQAQIDGQQRQILELQELVQQLVEEK